MATRQPLPTQSEPVDLGTAPLELVKARLGASGEGLTQSDAQTRLAQYGYNELPEEKVNPVLKFLSYFWGPIPWMIEIPAALSAVVHHWEDFGIILALLVMNASVGFWEGLAVSFLRSRRYSQRRSTSRTRRS